VCTYMIVCACCLDGCDQDWQDGGKDGRDSSKERVRVDVSERGG
jgi:hypothetical protein